jgi:SAM-dependent methyltransferase
MESLPEYERLSLRMAERSRLAAGFARQIELTAGPRLDMPLSDCEAIDIGCGYGYTAAELARTCKRVVGIEPNEALVEQARRTVEERGLTNLEVRRLAIGELDDVGSFDLAIMDNVLEHIEDQRDALLRLSRCLRVGGVAFILVPNKYWPIEVHYRLPFLSYLPLPLATRYLRASGRGTDYRDASYAPSYRRLWTLLGERPELDARFTLPADISLAEGGGSLVYRVGVSMLRRFPPLWALSKAFLIVAKKSR